MNIRYALIPLVWLLLFGCGSGGSDNEGGGVQELSLGKEVSGTIATAGEVDWYHYRAVEANNVLQVNASSNTFRPDVELLVTAYELDGAGNKVRIQGDHAPEGSQLPADLQMNVYIDQPKDIYLAVRDLMDDEASENAYYLSVDYPGGSEGDENFANANPLTVDDAASFHEGSIGTVGDIDCYTFDAAADGVYAVTVDYTPFAGGTDVDPTIERADRGFRPQ